MIEVTLVRPDGERFGVTLAADGPDDLELAWHCLVANAYPQHHQQRIQADLTAVQTLQRAQVASA